MEWPVLYHKTPEICEKVSPGFAFTAWSFHLAVHFYPIPALHFAENFTALPA